MSDPPLLWQYNFSNYNEKARWALDFKGIPHRRRSLMPGEPRAMIFAERGTLPVMDLGGDRYGDSTEIIAVLEQLHPEPALYPEDPADRAAALALEDHFDEGAGHDLRRAMFWDLRDQREFITRFLTTGQPAYKIATMRLIFPIGWIYNRRRYAIREAEAARSVEDLGRALDRIESERGGGDYLVGDTFSVADLTAAALLAPLVEPEQEQYGLPKAPLTPLRRELLAHPACEWVREMYARHRGVSAAIA